MHDQKNMILLSGNLEQRIKLNTRKSFGRFRTKKQINLKRDDLLVVIKRLVIFYILADISGLEAMMTIDELFCPLDLRLTKYLNVPTLRDKFCRSAKL